MSPDLCIKDFEVQAHEARDEIGPYAFLNVIHLTCGAVVYGFAEENPAEVNLEELLFIAQAHVCHRE